MGIYSSLISNVCGNAGRLRQTQNWIDNTVSTRTSAL